MQLLIIVCFLFHLVLGLDTAALHFHPQWHSWKSSHGKTYSSHSEEVFRHNVWVSNRKYIDEHNRQSDVHGFTLKMNHLGDLTGNEYCTQYACYHSLSDIHHNYTIKIYQPQPDNSDSNSQYQLPDTVDWRTKGAVSPVKDQGQCGSCYAFSAVGALEGAHSLTHDELVSLSEQNLVDCSVPYGNHGCDGGSMYNALRYAIDNGLDREEVYPYKGTQGECKFDNGGIGASPAGIVEIPSGSEKNLELAVATAGPIAVAIDSSSNAFRFYEKGIFDEPNCSTEKLTHAVLLIGYGKKNDKEYWLVKNSWGPNWGMKGYIMMAKGKANQCGIATAALFPTL